MGKPRVSADRFSIMRSSTWSGFKKSYVSSVFSFICVRVYAKQRGNALSRGLASARCTDRVRWELFVPVSDVQFILNVVSHEIYRHKQTDTFIISYSMLFVVCLFGWERVFPVPCRRHAHTTIRFKLFKQPVLCNTQKNCDYPHILYTPIIKIKCGSLKRK